MPDYLKRTGRDTTDDILVRVPESEKHISRLKGPASKRLGIDRGDITTVAAPLEGQMMIQYADQPVGVTPVAPSVGPTFLGETPYYFANGEWRPFVAAAGTSAEEHLNVVSTTVAANSSMFLDLVSYSGPSLVDVTTLPTRAVVNVDGLYTASGSVEVSLPGSEPAGDGIDFGVTAVQASSYPPSTPLPGVGTFVNPGNTSSFFYATGAVTGIMRGGLDWFQMAVTNRNSYDITVIAGLSIVLIG